MFDLGVQFPQEISRQDRLATTIGNSVDPQHPRFWHSFGAFRFSKVARYWQLIVSKEILAFSPLRGNAFAAVSSDFSHRQRFRSGNRLVNPDFAGRGPWFGSASYGSAPGDVGKQHRAHLGVAAECFSLDHLLVVPPKESLTELTINQCCPKKVRAVHRNCLIGRE